MQFLPLPLGGVRGGCEAWHEVFSMINCVTEDNIRSKEEVRTQALTPTLSQRERAKRLQVCATHSGLLAFGLSGVHLQIASKVENLREC